MPVAPRQPSPPASDTATTIATVVGEPRARPIPACSIGISIPSRSHSGVWSTDTTFSLRTLSGLDLPLPPRPERGTQLAAQDLPGGALRQRIDRVHGLAPVVVRDAEHRRLHDRRVPDEDLVDLARVDVDPAGDDRV